MTSEIKFDASKEHIHARVAQYYSEKLRQHGPTPKGVDWREKDSQEIRFARLLEILDVQATSLIELGCGYGALCGYLGSLGLDLAYHGYDVSQEMITAARSLYAGCAKAEFDLGSAPRQRADYCVASGIFNVRFDFSDGEWRNYFFDTIDLMAVAADKGFAFNCLTSFSDRDRQESRLYYADPGEVLNHCIARYGRRVSLLHGRPSYEFTVLVRHAPK